MACYRLVPEWNTEITTVQKVENMARSNGEADSAVAEICARHAAEEGPVLPILHDVQAHFGYVPDAAIGEIADGVVIASELIRLAEAAGTPEAAEEAIEAFGRGVVDALAALERAPAGGAQPKR